MKTKAQFQLYFLSLGSLLTLTGCGSTPDEDKMTYEHSPVTTVILVTEELDSKGVPTGIKDSVIARSLPVTSGNPAVEGTLDLKDAKSYTGRFRVFDESTSLPSDLTSEMDTKEDGHQFGFSTVFSKIYLTALSQDSKYQNYGRTFVFKTNGTGDDTLKVTLNHFDSGDKTLGTFTTDFTGSFPLQVK